MGLQGELGLNWESRSYIRASDCFSWIMGLGTFGDSGFGCSFLSESLSLFLGILSLGFGIGMFAKGSLVKLREVGVNSKYYVYLLCQYQI